MNKKIISIPPVYFFLCVTLGLIFYFFVPEMNLIHSFYSLILGILLLLTGLYFIFSAHFLLNKNDTSEKYQISTCVVKTGVYKYSRNPMYLGFLVVLAGLSFVTGNLLLFVCSIFFFIIMNWMFIPYEEEKMQKELGKDYLEYKDKVRRWL